MFDRNQILTILRQYAFDPNEYLVISGAALVLLRVKETTRDIDISVTKSYFRYLLTHYSCTLERVLPDGNCLYYIDNTINFGSNLYSPSFDLIEGIPVQKLEDVKKLKQYLNREKDQKDIVLIDKVLQKKF